MDGFGGNPGVIVCLSYRQSQINCLSYRQSQINIKMSSCQRYMALGQSRCHCTSLSPSQLLPKEIQEHQDEREQTMNQLLSEVDGFEGTIGVIRPSYCFRKSAPRRGGWRPEQHLGHCMSLLLFQKGRSCQTVRHGRLLRPHWGHLTS